MSNKPAHAIAIASAITIAVLAVCVFAGPRPINPFDISAQDWKIITSIRLPRVIVSALMGASLGASGAVLQAMLKNPLADPYILGLSGGAALFAVFGITAGIGFLGSFTIPAFAFMGAMATGGLVGILGYRKGGIVPERLLLSGIGIGFLFSAVLMLLMSATGAEGVKRAVLWMFGDLSMSDWPILPYGIALIAAGYSIAQWRAKALNSLMLGEEFSYSLGFNPKKEVLILFLAVGLMTASSVSLAGTVGFVGMLVPHIMRHAVGPDNRVLIPASSLAGAVLLSISDLIAKTAIQPAELPAGVVTAVIGAPYFLYILRRRHESSI